jgi:formate dehydrogenase subunit gamma
MSIVSRLCLVVGLSLGAGLASAQPAAQPGAAEPSNVQEQQKRQVTQPGNNAPVWRDVRSGQENFTTIKGRETGVLIQSGGDTWRRVRNGRSRSTAACWWC